MAFNFLAEVEKDTPVKYVSTSRGGQYHGPCPWCGGTDRFRLQPSYGTYGWFACNQCNRRGSAVDYLMGKRGYTKGKALATLEWKPHPSDNDPYLVPGGLIPRQALEDRPQWRAPSRQWQLAARKFFQSCHITLRFDPAGRVVLDYLHGRGLRDETIADTFLGYHPREVYVPAHIWGRPVKLPRGIVIPWLYGDSIWRLTIRDETRESGPRRYMQVAGGSNGLYAFHRGELPVVMTEGELDALSIMQECRDLVTAVATGTTSGSHTPYWVSLLAQQRRVFVAFDAERPGDSAARWWTERLAQAERLRPWWKDANQMLQDGADLREWVSAALSAGKEQEPAGTCCRCSAEVEYYDEQGRAYCQVHYPGEHHPRTSSCHASPGEGAAAKTPASSTNQPGSVRWLCARQDGGR